MNDLIPLKTDDRFPVNARDLWAFLGSRRQYADWVKARLGEMAALSEQDYTVSQNCEAGNRIDYYLTLDAAKHISMMERSEKGKQARHWFIQREKELAAIEANALPSPANMTKLDWIRTALESEERAVALAAKVEELTPKADQHDRRMSAEGFFNFRQAAKILGAGPNKLVTALRLKGYLYGTPAMPHESKNRDYFEVKWNLITTGETERQYPQTMVTPKGLQWLERKVTEWGV